MFQAMCSIPRRGRQICLFPYRTYSNGEIIAPYPLPLFKKIGIVKQLRVRDMSEVAEGGR